MRSDPYFERLSEAYAVISGIPDHQVTLDIERVSITQDAPSIGMNGQDYLPPSDWDTLVLTPDIWLSLCPAYIDIVEPLIETWEPYGVEVFWRIERRITSRFEVAMAYLFNLSQDLAEDLFGMRGDNEMDDRSDRQVFLDRILAFLQGNGEAVTVGIGHVEQQEMIEHGISVAEPESDGSERHSPAELGSRMKESVGSALPIQTGFAVLAMESDTPGPETFDTEASGTTVSPIVQEESVEKKSS